MNFEMQEMGQRQPNVQQGGTTNFGIQEMGQGQPNMQQGATTNFGMQEMGQAQPNMQQGGTTNFGMQEMGQRQPNMQQGGTTNFGMQEMGQRQPIMQQGGTTNFGMQGQRQLGCNMNFEMEEMGQRNPFVQQMNFEMQEMGQRQQGGTMYFEMKDMGQRQQGGTQPSQITGQGLPVQQSQPQADWTTKEQKIMNEIMLVRDLIDDIDGVLIGLEDIEKYNMVRYCQMVQRMDTTPEQIEVFHNMHNIYNRDRLRDYKLRLLDRNGRLSEALSNREDIFSSDGTEILDSQRYGVAHIVQYINSLPVNHRAARLWLLNNGYTVAALPTQTPDDDDASTHFGSPPNATCCGPITTAFRTVLGYDDQYLPPHRRENYDPPV